MIEINKLLTWGVLNYFNDRRADYLALSVKQDSTNYLTALKRMVISTPFLIPPPGDFFALYMYADQRIPIEASEKDMVLAKPRYYLVKQTAIETTSTTGQAPVALEMPIMAAIAQKMCIDFAKAFDTDSEILHYTDSTGEHKYRSSRVLQSFERYSIEPRVGVTEQSGNTIYAIQYDIAFEIMLSLYYTR